MDYLFLQCVDERCRFRFPATVAEARAVSCPRCHGPVIIAAEALKDKLPPSRQPVNERGLVVLLDNIRSIHNVGSMFRTADGAGVARLHLAGITATPNHSKLAKAALGAEGTVAWSYHPNGVDAVAALRAEGYRIWALERLPVAEPATMGEKPERLVLVVGNERAGVDPGILAQCDGLLSLPMIGQKSSLNAAVAFGIAVYSLQFGNVSS